MIRRRLLAHFANAPGAFYVVRGKTCTAVPGLIESDGDGCFFANQPHTAVEFDRAIESVVDAGGSVRYAGTGRKILDRLKEANAADACDMATMPDLRESLPARASGWLIARIPASWLLAFGKRVAARIQAR